MTDEDLLAHLQRDHGFPPQRLGPAIAAAREQGALAPEDELQAVAVLIKYKLGWLLIAGCAFAFVGLLVAFLVILAVQKSSLVLVSRRQVILTDWASARKLIPASMAAGDTLRVDR